MDKKIKFAFLADKNDLVRRECPECAKLSAKVVFLKSIEAVKKRLGLIDSFRDKKLEKAILQVSFLGVIFALDAYGRDLSEDYPQIFSAKAKNIFRNFKSLSIMLRNEFKISPEELIGSEGAKILNNFFQVRHIYEHNKEMDDYIDNLPYTTHSRGRKYTPDKVRILKFLDVLAETGAKIEERARKLRKQLTRDK